MQYKSLGRSDLKVSEIGFGCMSLGNNQQENDVVIQQAMDAGINFFDTADLYDKGWNEQTTGAALKKVRKEIIISTKVGNVWRADGSGWDWNPTKAYILKAVDQSLKRLQTDYIDLYQLHGGTITDPIDETIEAFEVLQQQGKIRYYGISSIRPNVIKAYVEQSKLVSVMMQYSLLDRRPEESCLPLLQENKIGVLARGGLAQGLLAGKSPKAYLNYSENIVIEAAKAIQAISDDKRNNAQSALRFALQQPAITATVVGIRTTAQLQDAVHAVSTPLLSEAELHQLKTAIPINYYDQHR